MGMSADDMQNGMGGNPFGGMGGMGGMPGGMKFSFNGMPGGGGMGGGGMGGGMGGINPDDIFKMFMG